MISDDSAFDESSKVTSDIEFRCAQALASGAVETCYNPEIARTFAIAYESNNGAEADAMERKLKARFGKDLNLKHFRRMIADVRKELLSSKPKPQTTGALTQIVVSNRQMRDITADAMTELRARNEPPALFVRSGDLAHIVKDEDGRPSVATVTGSYLRQVLSNSGDWMRYDKYGELKNSFPPDDIVKDVLATNPASWGFPKLSSVVEVPTLRPDGSVLDQAGYDESSTVFYSPAASLSASTLTVPDMPSQGDLRAATALIEEAIGEFPYDSQASHANMYGLLLTPILRPALKGSTPLAVVDAPQAGSGKSLIVNVLSLITTGRPAAMVPFPYKEEEMSKQIAASLLAGRQLICFDNLEGELRSPGLALALTAKEYECRLLGVTRNMTVPNLSTWVVTGNNIKPGGDMPRRCYQIRLNAHSSKPFIGRDFLHPNLEEWVFENRAALLHALLTIARYWYARGAPNLIDRAVGSFEDWHRTVGSIVKCAHITEFLGNYDAFIEVEDESPRQWEGFLSVVFDEYRGDADSSRFFMIADLLDRLQSTMTGSPALRDSMPSDLADCLEKKGNHRITVGKMFRNRRERHFGTSVEYWIEREENPHESTHKGSSAWRVCRRVKTAVAAG